MVPDRAGPVAQPLASELASGQYPSVDASQYVGFAKSERTCELNWNFLMFPLLNGAPGVVPEPSAPNVSRVSGSVAGRITGDVVCATKVLPPAPTEYRDKVSPVGLQVTPT